MARKPFDPSHSTVYKKNPIQPLKVQPPLTSNIHQERGQGRAIPSVVPPPPPPMRMPAPKPTQPNIPPAPVEPKVETLDAIPAPVIPAKSGRGGWKWCLLWLSVSAFCGGTGISALLWLSTVPPLPDCQQVSLLAADADRLYCAQQAAKSGKLPDLLAGIALVEPWSQEHPLYAKSQTSLQEWSQAILAMARQKMEQNDLAGAIALAEKIPARSPVRKEAEATIATWRKDQQQGEKIYQTVQNLLKAQKWQQAWEQTEPLADLKTERWRDRLSELRQQIMAEKQARSQFQQAQIIAQSAGGQVDRLGKAVVLVQQIDSKRYVYREAQAKGREWSRTLLDIATSRMQQQDMQGAIAAVQGLSNQAVPKELQELVWFSRAYQLTHAKQMVKQPLPNQIWELAIALPTIARIPKDSLFYPQAKTYLPRLEKQFQDLLHLHFASSLATMGHIPGLELAIRYAEAITPDRPARLYAQTLIAQWRKDIQRIEDRPYLLQAQTLAQAGTIPQLRAAIVEAQKIPLGRALRPEAQDAIFRWNYQIQTLEDKPTLDQARTLAKQGKLAKAIQTARKILPKRALYQQAQTAIQEWTAQIEIAEDRPILNEAWALADRGSLTAAINLASQITPDRALYAEAQSAIDRWMVQRAEIYRERALNDGGNSSRDPNWDIAPPESAPPESAPSNLDADSFPYPDALRNSESP
jgi:hypothetical protein